MLAFKTGISIALCEREVYLFLARISQKIEMLYLICSLSNFTVYIWWYLDIKVIIVSVVINLLFNA